MTKKITAAELSEIVVKMLAGQGGEVETYDAYASFLTEIATVVCDFCGGEVRHTATPDGDTWHVVIGGNDSLPEDGGIWSAYDPEGSLFDRPAKFAAGEWNHLFGVGSKETRCRIVIDLEQFKLVAAQEWTGLKFEDIHGERLVDLGDSVIATNEAHTNPDEFGLETTFELPEWAAQSVEPVTGGAEKPAEQGAPRLVVVGAHFTGSDADGPQYCAFTVDDALIARLATLRELCDSHDLAQVNVSLYPDAWGSDGFEDEMLLQGGDLIVCRNGDFYFNDKPKNSSGFFESKKMKVDELERLLASSDAKVVFSDESLRSVYAQDHGIPGESEVPSYSLSEAQIQAAVGSKDLRTFKGWIEAAQALLKDAPVWTAIVQAGGAFIVKGDPEYGRTIFHCESRESLAQAVYSSDDLVDFDLSAWVGDSWDGLDAAANVKALTNPVFVSLRHS